MVSNPADAAIVRAMVDLAHGLGLTVVAEGVEDSAILNDVDTLGCDLVQGSYLCSPLPAVELVVSNQWPVLSHPLSAIRPHVGRDWTALAS